MKTSRKVVLFFKSHIEQYTRKDGSVVRAHDDRRTKASDHPMKAHVIPKDEAHQWVHSDFKGDARTHAGSFGLNVNGKHWQAYMMTLDDYDQEWLKSSLKKPLADGERVFRYQSPATRAGGISPLVRINLHTKMVSFNESDDDDVVKFGKPVHAQYLNVVEGRH